MDGTPAGTTTPGQSGPGGNGNGKILHIAERSRTSFVSYQEHELGWGPYPVAEMQSTNSTASVAWFYSNSRNVCQKAIIWTIQLPILTL